MWVANILRRVLRRSVPEIAILTVAVFTVSLRRLLVAGGSVGL